jgi:hypothetical protein
VYPLLGNDTPKSRELPPHSYIQVLISLDLAHQMKVYTLKLLPLGRNKNAKEEFNLRKIQSTTITGYVN